MEEPILCTRCSTPLADEDKFCNNCGYPERGTDQEKDRFNHGLLLKREVVEDAQKKVKNVKILLFVIAGIHLLYGLYTWIGLESTIDGIANFIAAIVFLACVAWVNNQPLTGILAAFVFWILLQLSVVLVDPALLFNGIILKIIFIGIFIKGITSARDAQKYTEKLKV